MNITNLKKVFFPVLDEVQTDTELTSLIKDTYNDLAACRKNLEYAKDPTLIDMYSHELISIQMRCKYLLQIAKKQAK